MTLDLKKKSFPAAAAVVHDAEIAVAAIAAAAVADEVVDHSAAAVVVAVADVDTVAVTVGVAASDSDDCDVAAYPLGQQVQLLAFSLVQLLLHP